MPFRRRTTTTRRRPFRRTGRKLTTRQRQQVKKLVSVNVEKKHFDSLASAISSTGAWAITGPYVIPPQGDAYNERVGDVLHQVRFELQGNVIGSDSTNFTRLVVFKWAQNNVAGGPVPGDIFQDLVTLPYLSRLQDTSIEGHRFHLMMDRTFSTSINGTNAIAFKRSFWGKKLGAKKQTFNPGLNTGFNNIYIAHCSDSVAATHPVWSVTTRMIYTDA